MPRKPKTNPQQQPEPKTFKIVVDEKTIAVIPGIGATRQFIKYLTVSYSVYVESLVEGWKIIKLQ